MMGTSGATSVDSNGKKIEYRVFLNEYLLVKITMLEAHAFPILQINSGKDNHEPTLPLLGCSDISKTSL